MKIIFQYAIFIPAPAPPPQFTQPLNGSDYVTQVDRLVFLDDWFCLGRRGGGGG